MAIIIGGSTTRLDLCTTMAKPIDNEQFLEMSHCEFGQCEELDKQYRGSVTIRSPVSPIYNCHGLTFASRRTGVFENTVLEQILKEDHYMEIDRNNVLAGDVILYYGEDGDIEHSGVVIEPPIEEKLNVPKVYSKWGKYAEVIHLANNCPYNFSEVRYFRVNHGEFLPA